MKKNRFEMSWRKLFPFEPYPQQVEFMNDAEESFKKGKVFVAEACNGFGKTVCSLSTFLSLNKKIIYATRTHEQARQVLKEVARINNKMKTYFSAVSLAGREHLCLNKKCLNLKPAEASETCKILRSKGKCRYIDEAEPLIDKIPSILSIQTLIGFGRRERCCPYFLARKAAETFDVTVTPYQYVFNQNIRKKIGLRLGRKILIFDEAHNADKISLEALSDKLSERNLKNATEELGSIKEKINFIPKLMEYFNNFKDKLEIRNGENFQLEMKQILNIENADLVYYLKYVDKIREMKLEKGEPSNCFLNGVLAFLSLVLSGRSECYTTIIRISKYGYKVVEYRCLDPSLAMKSVFDAAEGVMIMSGTLSPINSFTKILDISGAEIKSYAPIAKPENIYTAIDNSVTTEFRHRSEEMLLKYGEEIVRILKTRNIPNGILVFFPQRELMMKAFKLWLKFTIVKMKCGSYSLTGKQIFVEGETEAENRRILEKYRRQAEIGEGAILLSVFRGRNAEGSNFPDEQARGIFLIGVPYADYQDPIVKAQIDYFNRKEKNLGRAWYTMDAFRAANQALGRGIRHRKDWCEFILMDYRYKIHYNMIVFWARNNIELLN